MSIRGCLMALLVALCAATCAFAQPTTSPAVDASTLAGKVICGYQGWFNAPGDGADRGWIHWARGAFKPGSVNVDLLPDMTELGPGERFPTELKLPDGKPLEVFSSYNAATVNRHFRWMREYGIDGVFLQRFATDIADRKVLHHVDKVVSNVMAGAAEHGRVFGMMYDLSGLREAQIDRVINDWKHLVDDFKITANSRYIHDRGKPVVAVWGYGFNDGRDPLIGDGGMRLIKFLKDDPVYGGNQVMLGVPTGWRTLDRDAVKDPALHRIIEAADIISPWTVGRYSTPAQAEDHARRNWAPDLAWCNEHQKQYLPVVFPGFSWHNLRDGKSPLNQIPRLGGRFLWSQFVAAKNAGATMVYQAMFDEVDEGTAIFKCTNIVPDPIGDTAFVTYEGLPSDFYLRLVGEASRLIRGEITAQDESLIAR
jgi:hypothetical protein